MSITNPLLHGGNPPPQLYIITGTDGAGKDTIIRHILNHNQSIHFAVTHTDRPARENEVDGKDYHFVSTQLFEQMLSQNMFIEHAVIYGYHKGVSKQEITAAMDSGKDVLLRVNIDGVISLKKQFPQSTAIFITVEDKEVLSHRLDQRNTDNASEKALRLNDVDRIYSLVTACDYIVINKQDNLEHSIDTVKNIMSVAKLRTIF